MAEPLLDPICLHEAGHAVVVRAVLGATPNRLIFIDGAQPEGQIDLVGELQSQGNGHDNTRIAAYLFGGLFALREGIKRGLLPPGSHEKLGFGAPTDVGSDCQLIERLATLPLSCADRVAAADLAKRAIAANWPYAADLAHALREAGSISRDELSAWLIGVKPV